MFLAEKPCASSHPQLPAHHVETMLTEQQIEARVRELGAKIGQDYSDSSTPLLLIAILKGATVFLADLIRAIPRHVEVDFITLSSYGAGTETTGAVRVVKDFEASVSGKDVLLVEDILDTGLTLHHSRLFETLREQGAASVKLCVLLDKQARRRVEIPVDYRGFDIEDHFVVGYGMDYAERYRNLGYIGVVNFVEES